MKRGLSCSAAIALTRGVVGTARAGLQTRPRRRADEGVAHGRRCPTDERPNRPGPRGWLAAGRVRRLAPRGRRTSSGAALRSRARRVAGGGKVRPSRWGDGGSHRRTPAAVEHVVHAGIRSTAGRWTPGDVDDLIVRRSDAAAMARPDRPRRRRCIAGGGCGVDSHVAVNVADRGRSLDSRRAGASTVNDGGGLPSTRRRMARSGSGFPRTNATR